MGRILSTAFALSIGVLAGMLPATAQDQQAGDIILHQAWAPATPGGARSAAGYVRIENTGGEPDQLLGVSSEIAEVAALHGMSVENDFMKMGPAGILEIPAGGSVELKPHGTHIMLMGLHKPLAEGDTFPVTLKFARAGSVDLRFVVMAAGSSGPEN